MLVSLLQLSCSYSLSIWASKDAEEQKKSKWPGLLGAATVGYLFFSFSRAFLGVLIINSNAKNMMRKMTESVIRAKILFFDSNPIGRIVTRFSKDITVIDQVITFTVINMTYGVLKLATTVVIVAIMSPWILIPTFVLFALIYFIMRIGVPALNEA